MRPKRRLHLERSEIDQRLGVCLRAAMPQTSLDALWRE